MQAVSVELAEESDAGLLYLIGEATGSPADQSLAHDAMREFHARHYPYVLDRLNRFAENLGTVVIDVEKFAAVTFEKAFRRAARFKDTSNGNRELAARKAKAWLGMIASNLARDELDRISRHQCGMQLVPLDESTDAADESSESVEPFDTVPTNPRALAALKAVLESLKTEERDILMTYGAHGIPTSTGRQLPKDVRDALEQRTGYERRNIRQKWHRLSQRLKSELEPFLSNRNKSPLHA